MSLRIGGLAKRTGANAPTIRYYEAIGLLPPADRREGGQRCFDEDDVERLTFIRRCRDFGFPIEQVRTLLSLMHDPARSCTEARDLAQQHLEAVQAKLVELKALERSIAGFVQTCDLSCAGGPAPDCTIMKDIAEPRGFIVSHRRVRVTPRSAPDGRPCG